MEFYSKLIIMWEFPIFKFPFFGSIKKYNSKIIWKFKYETSTYLNLNPNSTRIIYVHNIFIINYKWLKPTTKITFFFPSITLYNNNLLLKNYYGNIIKMVWRLHFSSTIYKYSTNIIIVMSLYLTTFHWLPLSPALTNLPTAIRSTYNIII